MRGLVEVQDLCRERWWPRRSGCSGAVSVAAAAVHRDGGLEVVFAVEVDPAEAGGAGGVF